MPDRGIPTLSGAASATAGVDLPEDNHEAFLDALARGFDGLKRVREAARPGLRIREIGRITAVLPGVVRISGLTGARFEEVVRFRRGRFGLVCHLDDDEVGCIVLGDGSSLAAGEEVTRTGEGLQVPVGEGLLGRVLDPTGRPLDHLGPLDAAGRRPLEREAPPIMDRLPVTVPLQTGIKVIDALIPIGRGQRELIVGDRQTGKTAIALSAIVNQRQEGVVSIYCAIGQRGASVAKAIAHLRETGALPHAIVVVAPGETGPGLPYIAPYAATAIGEYFMDRGRDVLIVYDDLGAHARAYREISLLLRRPPGREAFPGDIFYLHSRLLERATRLRTECGGGSLTALPIVETEAQNIAAFIPTNLISITDGQIYLSPVLFQKGILPAVDVGRSVSRVGGKAQNHAYQEASKQLKLFYSQFEELEMFSRFGTRLHENTRRIIAFGRRIRHCLQQGLHDRFDLLEQIAVLLALTHGVFDPVADQDMARAEKAVRAAAAELPASTRETIVKGKSLTQDETERIVRLARQAVARDAEARAGETSAPATREVFRAGPSPGGGGGG